MTEGQGFTVFFTGLSASGKTTLADALEARLRGSAGRLITMLDGDVVRKAQSADLGYSRADRDANIRRAGAMAADVTAAGGVAICSFIAPYDAARKAVRAIVEPAGPFVLVYVSTPLIVCERRDPKGLYAKARAGLIAHFTGVSDPYEAPDDAEVIVDASVGSPDQAVDQVMEYLRKRVATPRRS